MPDLQKHAGFLPANPGPVVVAIRTNCSRSSASSSWSHSACSASASSRKLALDASGSLVVAICGTGTIELAAASAASVAHAQQICDHLERCAPVLSAQGGASLFVLWGCRLAYLVAISWACGAPRRRVSQIYVAETRGYDHAQVSLAAKTRNITQDFPSQDPPHSLHAAAAPSGHRSSLVAVAVILSGDARQIFEHLGRCAHMVV